MYIKQTEISNVKQQYKMLILKNLGVFQLYDLSSRPVLAGFKTPTQ